LQTVHAATNTHCLHKRLQRRTDFTVNTTKSHFNNFMKL